MQRAHPLLSPDLEVDDVQPEHRGSPTADRRALATALRSLREKAGLSLEAAAAQALEASAAKLSRLETGRQVAGARDVRDLCELYGTAPERRRELLSWAASAREVEWYEQYETNDDDFVGLESAATRIRDFQVSYIPALLQTPEYARRYVEVAIVPGRSNAWPAADVDKVLELRSRRVAALDPSSGVSLSFVVDESALLRAVGGQAVMGAQLEHLIEVATQPNVVLRILPLAAGASPGQLGGFTLLNVPNTPDTAYVESQEAFSIIDDDRLKHFERVWVTVLEQSADPSETTTILARMINSVQP